MRTVRVRGLLGSDLMVGMEFAKGHCMKQENDIINETSEVENFDLLVRSAWLEVFDNLTSADATIQEVHHNVNMYLEPGVPRTVEMIRNVFRVMYCKCEDKETFKRKCRVCANIEIQGKSYVLEEVLKDIDL